MLTLENAVFRQGAFDLTADIQIASGQVTAVIGPSGAGKSTLLGGIAGFVPQMSGRSEWNGDDFTQNPPEKRPVAMLFQDNNLFPHLTVMQNVALALGRSLRPSKLVQDRVEAMLSRVGLSGMSGCKPSALSGGQQSRVALTRALLQDRPLMLLDEPFSALGPALKAEMLDLTVELAEGRTLIMITHDPQDAVRIADAIVGVVLGAALWPVSTDTFLSAPPDQLRDYFTSP